ncbi:TMV resistance protein N-like [Pistacia vera]|uniref:TMV resistance protein N-like n=1 Tax=Pistacia vera TaxID=55513 RepID=UPI001262FAF4|nr:TMV resistance protein N-like [Pistacia vera]
MAASSSSSSSSITQVKYDVFLSFRGEDVRDNFISHLDKALRRKKIKTFIDAQLDAGEKIAASILKAIEESKISVIIFSENYAGSRWLLDELIKIIECKNLWGQIVRPVFYHIDPSDVRNQTGAFGEVFSRMEERFKDSSEKLVRFRSALKEAASISGFYSSDIW